MSEEGLECGLDRLMEGCGNGGWWLGVGPFSGKKGGKCGESEEGRWEVEGDGNEVEVGVGREFEDVGDRQTVEGIQCI